MGYLVVYGAGFLLPQVGGFQVGQMQLDGDGVFIVGHAYGKILPMSLHGSVPALRVAP